jgi:hypothetical protein
LHRPRRYGMARYPLAAEGRVDPAEQQVRGMHTATRRRTAWAVAASAIAHVAVAIVLLLQRTTLVVPVGESGPPQPIIPILIVPRTPPTSAGREARPTPIRLHRRPQPFLPPQVEPAPIAPPAPPASTQPPTPPRGPVALHPAPMPEGPKGDVRTALRAGSPGCANRDAVGLNGAERELCDEKFGKGAKEAEFAGLGLTAEKQRLLDGAGGKKEADYRFRQTPITPNTAPGARDATAPHTAEQMCADLGVSPDECGVHARR